MPQEHCSVVGGVRGRRQLRGSDIAAEELLLEPRALDMLRAQDLKRV